nr:MAG TPA: hypothetical protein [Caudoviricetes sp.]
MMQGDAYAVPFVIRQGETKVTPDMVETVELTIGMLSRLYPGEVTYDQKKGQWLFPLTQEQTMDFAEGSIPTQVRVKFMDGRVIGAKGGAIQVAQSASKGVI